MAPPTPTRALLQLGACLALLLALHATPAAAARKVSVDPVACASEWLQPHPLPLPKAAGARPAAAACFAAGRAARPRRAARICMHAGGAPTHEASMRTARAHGTPPATAAPRMASARRSAALQLSARGPRGVKLRALMHSCARHKLRVLVHTCARHKLAHPPPPPHAQT